MLTATKQKPTAKPDAPKPAASFPRPAGSDQYEPNRPGGRLFPGSPVTGTTSNTHPLKPALGEAEITRPRPPRPGGQARFYSFAGPGTCRRSIPCIVSSVPVRAQFAAAVLLLPALALRARSAAVWRKRFPPSLRPRVVG